MSVNLCPPVYSGGPAGKVFGPTRSGASGTWGNPFADMASVAMPDSHTDMLLWSETIICNNGELRTAIEKVLSYFITDIIISGCSDKERERYEKFLEDLGIRRILYEIGFNYLIYGNAFVSILPAHHRNLVCKHCRKAGRVTEVSLREAMDNPKYRFKFESFEYRATCPRCTQRSSWKVVDRKGEAKDILVKCWNPHRMEIREDDHSGRCEYILKVGDDYKQQVQRGQRIHIENVNLDMLRAMKQSKYFEFERGELFHLKETTPAGIKMRGWGLSRTVSNFKQAWHVAVLKRYNEAYALEYIMPWRVVSPAQSAVNDPTSMAQFGSGAMFRQEILRMARLRSRDPASIHVVGQPFDYKVLGAEAQQMAPKDLIDSAQELLLNNFGIPYDLFRGSLQLQAAPVALRVFESHWNHLVRAMNLVLGYLADRLSTVLGWEKADFELERVTTADDIGKQQTKLQLAAGQQISQTTGLRSIGVDWREELRRKMEEEKFTAELQTEYQEEIQNSEQAKQMYKQPPGQQAAPPGQAPQGQQGQQGQQAPYQPPQGGGAGQQFAMSAPSSDMAPVSPQDQWAQADAEAQRLLPMTEQARTKAMIQLKRTKPTLHAAVKVRIEDLRREAGNAGRDQVIASTYGGQQ